MLEGEIVKTPIMKNRSVCLTVCSFLLALAVSFACDGATSKAFAQLTTADCLVCHNDAFWLPSVADANQSAAAAAHHSTPSYLYGCQYCHYAVSYTQAPDNCTACHSAAGHQADHDKTAVPSTECSSCHLGNVYDEHASRPSAQNPDGTLNCAVCHSSTNVDVQAAIAKGSGPTGQTVTCDECHTGMGATHEADHDKTVVNGPECLQCHASNVVTEHVTNRGIYCSACHSSTDPLVIDAIAKGKGAAPYSQPQEVLCTDCHGLDVLSHEAVHDHTFLPTVAGQNCTQCHVANVVTEHVVNRDFTCAVCHNSSRPEVLQAIEDGRDKEGMPPSLDIYCIRCHEASGQGEGHALITVEPWSECIICHDDITYNSNPLLVFHDEHVGYAEDLSLGCATCHAQAPDVPNCEACHQLDSTIWGTLPRGSTNLNIIGPNSEDHDKHTRIILCSTCHVTTVPGGTPIPPPYNACDSCHTTLQYGQAGHSTHITAAANNCNVCHTAAPNCGQCHAAGHEPVPAPYNGCDSCHTTLQPGQATHNAHRTAAKDNCAACHTAAPNCGECHAAGHPPVPAPYNDCDSCHTTLPPGQPTHDLHRQAANQDCALCHNAAPNCGQCHAAGHQPVPAPYNECDKCHLTLQPGQVTHNAHRTAANDNCARCHTAQPDCSSCHGNTHHTTTQAQSGNCTYCHADRRLGFDPNAPAGQLACRQCHVGSNGFVKTGTGAPSHAFNTTGAIKDYGACFACHQPNPYHGKPTTRPRDCYATTATAPGKGSFNLFSSQFGGGGEHNERNENCENREDTYRNPAVQFNWATITNHLGDKLQYRVPTFGTGTTPPANDTITITKAEWNSSYRRIQVYATNTLGTNATLTMKYGGKSYTMSWNSNYKRWEKTVSYVSYYSTVEVVSSKGGSKTANVTKR